VSVCERIASWETSTQVASEGPGKPIYSLPIFLLTFLDFVVFGDGSLRNGGSLLLRCSCIQVDLMMLMQAGFRIVRRLTGRPNEL